MEEGYYIGESRAGVEKKEKGEDTRVSIFNERERVREVNDPMTRVVD